MTTSNLAFNGSSLTFGGSPVGNIISITDANTCEEIDVSAANQDAIFEAGQLKRAINIKIVGGPATALACKTKGALQIAWHDGTVSAPITNALLTQSSPEGSKNQPISTTLKFVPSTAAAA